MRKLTLIMFLIFASGAGLFAQQSSPSKSNFGKDPYFAKNTELKLLAEKVNTNYQILQNSSTMSRAGVQKANHDYDEAVKSYHTALNKALSEAGNDASIIKIIQNELNELKKASATENEINDNKPNK